MVDCGPEILMNALKYRTDSCANFFVRSTAHVGQLHAISLFHDSNGTFYVNYIEVVRLDSDPKTKFQVDVEENILPEKAYKRRKYIFDSPKDVEPDPDARPTNTMPLYELIPFFVLALQVASLTTLFLLEYFCTDVDSGGCSRFSLVGIGVVVGIAIFFFWIFILFLYINIIRKGLFNNLGLDSCNFFRGLTLILVVASE